MRSLPFALFLSFVIIIAVIIGFAAYRSYTPRSPAKDSPAEEGSGGAQGPALQPPTRPAITSTDPIRGNPNATVTIFEFGDFLCPACADMSPILQATLAKYDGRVKLVWKDLPNTTRNFLSQKAAEAARCAGEQGGISLRSTGSPSASQRGEFWQYHDLLFEKLEQGQSLSQQELSLLAQEMGLDTADFSECLDSGRMADFVDRTLQEALLLEVDATPYFFIGNTRVSGALSENELREIIDLYAK